MKNQGLQQYIEWRGDLSFSADPFRDTDNVILCELSYVDYAPARDEDASLEKTIRECGKCIIENGAYVLKTLDGGHRDFFELACASKRFGDIVIRNYEEMFDENSNLQFCAMEFVLDARTSYIAFRGTDNTIVGWKEDFMMSFTQITSQPLAAEYLKKVMRPFRKYYVGGHSKGGNLAVYACAMLAEKERKKIIRIYNNDGPGFSPDNMDFSLLEPLAERLIRIVPSFCVVGRIFEVPYGETKIVSSSETGILQHDLISWDIRGGALVGAKGFDDISSRICDAVDRWLEDISTAERKQFVEEVFTTLTAGGAATVQEVTGKGFLKVLSAAASSSELSRRLVKDLGRTVLMKEKTSE